MESNWDFYFANVNDKLSSIFVDLGYAEVAPLQDKPWLFFIFIELNAPRDDGLSSKEEAPRLFEIQDALEPALESLGCSLAGRITGDGYRSLYCYAAQTIGLESAVVEVMRRFPEYRFKMGSKSDPDWNQYFDVLYPSNRDKQRMSNRHVLEQLEKHGDRHDLHRMVDHCMYFKTEKGRVGCKAMLLTEGFEVDAEETSDDLDVEMPFSLVIKRSDSVEWDRINEITLQLCELAERHDGAYDGWGCEVETGE